MTKLEQNNNKIRRTIKQDKISKKHEEVKKGRMKGRKHTHTQTHAHPQMWRSCSVSSTHKGKYSKPGYNLVKVVNFKEKEKQIPKSF